MNSIFNVLLNRSRHRKANLTGTIRRIRRFLLTFKIRNHNKFIGGGRVKFHHRHNNSNRTLRLTSQRTNQRALTMSNRTSWIRRSISLLISSI